MTLLSLKNRVNRLKDKLLSVAAIRVAVGTVEELSRGDASHLAAGVAYFAVLSLFPLLLAFISLSGLFLSSESVQELTSASCSETFRFHPISLSKIFRTLYPYTGVLGVLSVLALIWTSANMFTAIGVALNRSWRCL